MVNNSTIKWSLTFQIIFKLECDRISSTVELIYEGMLYDLKVEAQTNWTSFLCGFDLPKDGFGVAQHGNSREIFSGRKILCYKRFIANSYELRIGFGFWLSPPHTFSSALNIRELKISHKKALISGKCLLRTRLPQKPVNAILNRVCFHVGTRAEECWPAEILMCVFVACVSRKVDMSFIRTPTSGVYCTSE